jgi:hypothetical protein
MSAGFKNQRWANEKKGGETTLTFDQAQQPVTSNQ